MALQTHRSVSYVHKLLHPHGSIFKRGSWQRFGNELGITKVNKPNNVLARFKAQEFLDHRVARPFPCAPFRAQSHAVSSKQKILNGGGSGSNVLDLQDFR